MEKLAKLMHQSALLKERDLDKIHLHEDSQIKLLHDVLHMSPEVVVHYLRALGCAWLQACSWTLTLDNSSRGLFDLRVLFPHAPPHIGAGDLACGDRGRRLQARNQVGGTGGGVVGIRAQRP